MASMMVVVLAICLFIPAVRPSSVLWTLNCDPEVGIADQTTVIKCNFEGINKEMKIYAVSLKKVTRKEPVFQHVIENKQLSDDKRFSLENTTDPSLQISGTRFSDAGAYEYTVTTNRGKQSAKFNIIVTAMYEDPVISTWPENVIDGGPVELYCNATGGYPAGTIHWFDRSETNWTINSILTKVERNTSSSKSVALSSKLTFKSIDLSLAPFRCIVLNYKNIQEGEKTFEITSANHSSKMQELTSNTKQIVAGVMVIGSLIVGLLITLLIFRKRQARSFDSVHTAESDIGMDPILNKA